MKILFLIVMCFIFCNCKNEKTNTSASDTFPKTVFIPAKKENLLPSIEKIYFSLQNSQSKIVASAKSDTDIAMGLLKKGKQPPQRYSATLYTPDVDTANIEKLELRDDSGHIQLIHICDFSTCSIDLTTLLEEQVCDNGEVYVTLAPQLSLNLMIYKKDTTQQEMLLRFGSICQRQNSAQKDLGARSVASSSPDLSYWTILLSTLFGACLFAGFVFVSNWPKKQK